jgi:hypothetical protein
MDLLVYGLLVFNNTVTVGFPETAAEDPEQSDVSQ